MSQYAADMYRGHFTISCFIARIKRRKSPDGSVCMRRPPRRDKGRHIALIAASSFVVFFSLVITMYVKSFRRKHMKVQLFLGQIIFLMIWLIYVCILYTIVFFLWMWTSLYNPLIILWIIIHTNTHYLNKIFLNGHKKSSLSTLDTDFVTGS